MRTGYVTDGLLTIALSGLVSTLAVSSGCTQHVALGERDLDDLTSSDAGSDTSHNGEDTGADTSHSVEDAGCIPDAEMPCIDIDYNNDPCRTHMTFATDVFGSGYLMKLALADVSNDGLSDVIVVDMIGSGVSQLTVFVNDGNRRFHRAHHWRLDDVGLSSVNVADFDGDGINDIVATDSYSSDILIFYNDFYGQFSSGHAVPGIPEMVDLEPGDLNGDGRNDFVAVASTGCFVVGFNEGDGVGSFNGEGSFCSITSDRSESVAVGDFNGDSHNDFAVANMVGNVAVYLNEGSGRFGTSALYPASNPRSLITGDVNGDDILDLIYGNSDGALAVSPGNADGTFLDPVLQQVNGGAQLALGDFEIDRDLDLASLGARSGTNVEVLTNLGDGRYAGTATYRVPTDENSSPSTYDVAVDDIDRDGLPDIAVTVEVDYHLYEDHAHMVTILWTGCG